MNRRSFLTGIIAAGISAAILPSALTYERTWKKTAQGLYVLNPDWVNAPYEIRWLVTDKNLFEAVVVPVSTPVRNCMIESMPIRLKFGVFDKQNIIEPFKVI